MLLRNPVKTGFLKNVNKPQTKKWIFTRLLSEKVLIIG